MNNKVLQWADKETGEFKRQISSFRDKIEDFVSGRYRLYVSLACPWAHRTLIMRRLKNLENEIDLSVVDYVLGEGGWRFSSISPEPQYNAEFLKELYLKSDPNYEGRITVPVLWDIERERIINNESSDIIRILNEWPGKLDDFYPEPLRSEIDVLNTWVYDGLNNGVYKAGFATKQEVYEKECRKVFKTLDRIEEILSSSQKEYIMGDSLTEADIRIFTTIVRFDPVYFGHFKCNLKSIAHDYPGILRWMKRLYQKPEFSETTNMIHIKRHYYMSHLQINPNRIVPLSDGCLFETK